MQMKLYEELLFREFLEWFAFCSTPWFLAPEFWSNKDEAACSRFICINWECWILIFFFPLHSVGFGLHRHPPRVIPLNSDCMWRALCTEESKP